MSIWRRASILVFRLSIFVLAVFVGYFVGVVGDARADTRSDVGDDAISS